MIALLLAGHSTDAMAVALGVSRSTVHSHVQSILRKLGARSRIEAVSIYLGETTQLVDEPSFPRVRRRLTGLAGVRLLVGIRLRGV